MATKTRILHLEFDDIDGVSDVVDVRAIVAVSADVSEAERKAGAGFGRVDTTYTIARADMPALLALLTRAPNAVLDALPAVEHVKPPRDSEPVSSPGVEVLP